MSSRVFVGNLPYGSSTPELKAFVEEHGYTVKDAIVMVDRMTGRSRGFGFVTFSSTEEANKAIQELSGQDFGGRAIRLDMATERGGGGPRQASSHQGGGGGGHGWNNDRFPDPPFFGDGDGDRGRKRKKKKRTRRHDDFDDSWN